MKTLKHRIIRLTALSAYLAALLVSALVVATPTASAAENAFIRFLHASPALDNVDVLIDEHTYLEDFAFASITDNYDYGTHAAGDFTIRVVAAGADASEAVIEEQVTLAANGVYTLVILGTDEASLELVAYEDDNTIPQPGVSKARVYNFCADCGQLDIALAELGGQGINDLDYKSASEYLYVPAGTYTVNGTLPNGQQVPFQIDLQEGYVSSGFVVGLVQGEPALQLIGSRVAGTPGLPNTGNDPQPGASFNWTLVSLIAGAVVLCTAGAGAAFWLRRSRHA